MDGADFETVAQPQGLPTPLAAFPPLLCKNCNEIGTLLPLFVNFAAEIRRAKMFSGIFLLDFGTSEAEP
jgi:hypothetical protein